VEGAQQRQRRALHPLHVCQLVFWSFVLSMQVASREIARVRLHIVGCKMFLVYCLEKKTVFVLSKEECKVVEESK